MLTTVDKGGSAFEPTIIYIMGTARSGTTVLEILLAQSDEVFGAGEISGLLQDGYIDNDVCSCGSRFDSCEVWSIVRGLVQITPADAHSLHLESKKHERHTGVLASLAGLNKISAKYSEFNESLFSALFSVTNSRAVVDSSKYSGRALSLVKLFDKNVRVIWLTRSPSGIFASFEKKNKVEQKEKSRLAAFSYVLYVTFVSFIVKKRLGGKCLLVSYESLLNSPENELRVIQKWSGVDLTKSITLAAEQGELGVGHLITGNRLRKNATIRIERKPESSRSGGLLNQIMNIWYSLLGLKS